MARTVFLFPFSTVIAPLARTDGTLNEYAAALEGTPHLIAEFDAAGDIVGLQFDAISAETLGLADEFLGLLDLTLPDLFSRTLRS